MEAEAASSAEDVVANEGLQLVDENGPESGAKADYNSDDDGVGYIDINGEERRVSFGVVNKLGGQKTHVSSGVHLKVRGRDFVLSEKLCWLCSVLISAVVIAIVLCVGLVPRVHPTRTYFVGIDEIDWSYTPSPINNCTGEPFAYPDTTYTQARTGTRIGSVYRKAVFRAYTDDTFQTLAPRPPEWEHLGLLGPALHAEVGDVVEVVVRNNARFPFSFAAQAVGTNKANEGVSYRQGNYHRSRYFSFDDALPPLSLGVRDCGTVSSFLSWRLPTSSSENGRVTPGDAHSDSGSLDRQDFCRDHEVKAAESRTYTVFVDEAAGPGPADGSSVMHLYTSHVGGHAMTIREGGYDGFGADSNAGLMGPLIVTRKGHADAAGRPADVDREFVVLMNVQDENQSPYFRTNIWEHLVAPILNQARPPGYVPFGPTSKPAALQALYYAATKHLDKISFADADALIKAANAENTYVGVVNGYDIHVWFTETSYFDPRWYDAKNGGYGSALAVLEQQWKETVDVNDLSFRESNAMHAINGYLYCTQPGLTMRAGERVRWYTGSVGGKDSVHTAHWHGNTLLYGGKRSDQFEMLASSTATADMVPENPGIWQLHCHVNDHKKAGMLSFYQVEAHGPPPSATCAGLAGTTRVYYVAAEATNWSYYDASDAAAGIDRCAGGGTFATQAPKMTGLLRRALAANGVDRVGTTLVKARYVRYTDATFTTRFPEPAWKGLLGATLRASVGDTIRVVARNNLPFPISFHPHGVQYQKGAEGAPYNDKTNGTDKLDDSLAPGTSHEYVWCVPESAGPGPKDGSSIVWLYHDHVHEINGTNAGLAGPIIISNRATADPTSAIPNDVDHEFVLLFAAHNENGALHTEVNMANLLPMFRGNNMSLPQAERGRLTYLLRKYDTGFADSMRKRGINGKLQCSLQGLSWAVGDRVRLHLLAMGDGLELHAPTLTGQAFEYQGARTAAVGLMASSMKTVDFTASAAGTLLLSTGSDSGAERGMNALVQVSGAVPAVPSVARTYYIAADEVDWDFLPTGKSMCGAYGTKTHSRADTLHAMDAPPGGYLALGDEGFNGWEDNNLESEFSLYTSQDADPHRLGTRYVLALYREYVDDSFNTLRVGPKSRANKMSAHLGMQGPVLRALPGETIAVRLLNRLRYPCNFVVQGLRPVGGLAAERPLLPGEIRTIMYVVDRENAPMAGQTSMAFAYRSDYRAAVAGAAAHATATGKPAAPMSDFADSNAGLFGAIVVTRSKEQVVDEKDLAPDDVNHEFVLFMGVMDQNKSPYLGLNIAQFAAAPESVDRDHPDFKESNRKHAINGRMYCNLDGLEILIDRKARWYVFALGTDDAFASPRWYGHAPLVHGSRTGSVLVQPGTGVVADVHHNNYGQWLFEDQTSDHAHAGAVALFTVHRKIISLCEQTFWNKC